MRTSILDGRSGFHLCVGSICFACLLGGGSLYLLAQPAITETEVRAEISALAPVPVAPKIVAAPEAVLPANGVLRKRREPPHMTAAFMPDDYLKVGDLRTLIRYSQGRVQVRRAWPGEGYIFLGTYDVNRGEPLLVWYRGVEIPAELLAVNSKTRSSDRTRDGRCVPEETYEYYEHYEEFPLSR